MRSPEDAAAAAAEDGPCRRAAERTAVAALTLAAFAMALNANVLGPLLPFLEEELHLAKGDMGSLIGVASWAGAIGALLLGPVVDRRGRRIPMLWGTLLFVAASLAHLFTPGYEPLVAVRAVAGFAAGVVFTGASAAVADLVPYERRGAAMGVFSGGIFLAVLALPIATLLAQAGRWRAMFAVQGAVGLIALALLWRSIPAAHPGAAAAEPRVSQFTVLRQPMVVPGLLAVLLYVGAFTATVQLSGAWLDESGVVPKTRQQWVWAVVGLGAAAGSLWLARYSDPVGKRRFVLWTTAAVAAGILALTLVGGPIALAFVGVPLGVVSAARTGPLQALLSEIVPRHMRGTLMGVRAAAVNLGIGAFAEGFGRVYGAWSFDHVLCLSAGAIATSWLLVRVFLRGAR